MANQPTPETLNGQISGYRRSIISRRRCLLFCARFRMKLQAGWSWERSPSNSLRPETCLSRARLRRRKEGNSALCQAPGKPDRFFAGMARPALSGFEKLLRCLRGSLAVAGRICGKFSSDTLNTFCVSDSCVILVSSVKNVVLEIAQMRSLSLRTAYWTIWADVGIRS